MTAVTERYRPLYRTAPPWSETDGDLATRLAADLGWNLDAVQQGTIDAALAVDSRGMPACPEVAIVGPRQTVGKTVAFEVAALFELFIAEVPLHVWTAHQYSTSQKTWRDMKGRIERSRDYASRCEFREANGEQAIIADNGCRIEFHARSGKGGRGFPGVRRITLDEWLYGRPGDLGALAPTMVTQPDAQIRYASSAGFPMSRSLRGLRKRGRAGGDARLAYVELGAVRRGCVADEGRVPPSFELSRCRHEIADPTCALNDRDLWWQANSGLWVGRVTEEAVATQRGILSDAPQEFAREFLSWWEDPPNEDGGALDMAAFALLADPLAERGRPVTFGVAVAEDRSWSAISAAWPRPGGLVQAQVIDYRPHTTWVTDRITELRRSWGGRVVVDSRGQGLLPEGVSWLDTPSEREQAHHEAALSDRLTARTLRHDGAPELLTAARAATWRTSGALRRLESSGSIDVSPLRALALAVGVAGTAVDPLDQVW